MDFTKVSRFLETLGEAGVPGTDLSIYLEGKEVYRRQTGYADIETKSPILPDTLYAMWSMTKVITCTAALRLFEEGRYLMSDPVSEYLPCFREMTYKKGNTDGESAIAPCTRPIRIVDLFTMSSGLSYDISARLVKAADTAPAPDLANFMLELSREPLCFEPGTHWRYGLSHDVLGMLIEILSGMPFGEYLSKHIFEPLSMQDTFFDIALPNEKAHRLASAYTFNEETRKNDKATPVLLPGNWKAESGGAGLISTVDDYMKFAAALCSGGTASNGYRLLGKATIDLMRTNHLCPGRMSEYNEWIPHNRGYGYGLGVRTLTDKAFGGLNSNIGEFGWSGMLGTYVLIDPSTYLTYVYAQQLTPSKEEWVAPRLRNIIYGCL